MEQGQLKPSKEGVPQARRAALAFAIQHHAG